MRPAELDRLTVVEAADRYVELVRAKTLTGALSPATAEVYARDVATLVALAGERTVLDDLTGEDVDAILLAFARKPDGRGGPTDAGSRQSASSPGAFPPVDLGVVQARDAGRVGADQPDGAGDRDGQGARAGCVPERRALTREQAQGLIGAAPDLGRGAAAAGAAA